MTDPGWDIPGVARDAGTPPAADVRGSSAADSFTEHCGGGGSPRRGGKSGRRTRAGSVSACSGLSAGAFGRLADAGAAAAARTDSLPGPGALGTATAGAHSARSSASIDAPVADAATLTDIAGAGACSTSGGTPVRAAASSDSLVASNPVQALAFLNAGLEFLARANPAEWAEGLQADCLRALAVAESRQAAAHARVLAAFSVPGGGVAGDGHRSPRVWLCWQTHATRKAAATKVSWMHRLAAHPAVADALAGASVSVSWAQQIMDWTKPLPDQVRDHADQELLAAAAAGASLTDLAGIAEDIRREHARPDDDGDGDGFKDRGLRLARTFGGAGRLEADLSARCTTALETVLGSLSRPYGAEDTRTPGQRQHDALEEAMLRLIGADGLLPQQAGRPVRLELDITLQDLINGGTGSPAGPGAACDAMIQPVITGMADHDQATRHGNPHDLPGTAADDGGGDGTAAAGRSTTTACPPGSTTPATRTGGTKSSRPPPVRRPKHPGRT